MPSPQEMTELCKPERGGSNERGKEKRRKAEDELPEREFRFQGEARAGIRALG
ncbi:hypothetical protein BD413DRAFT_549987 [Trametes elegans]|nr:hypothetical protein BD413DRAFT_549987 [Trametes elegans]